MIVLGVDRWVGVGSPTRQQRETKSPCTLGPHLADFASATVSEVKVKCVSEVNVLYVCLRHPTFGLQPSTRFKFTIHIQSRNVTLDIQCIYINLYFTFSTPNCEFCLLRNEESNSPDKLSRWISDYSTPPTSHMSRRQISPTCLRTTSASTTCTTS